LALTGCHDWAAELEWARLHEARHKAHEQALAEAEARLRLLEAEVAELSARVATAEARVVVYRPTKALTASGRRGRPGRTCAVSRPLMARLGLAWGDLAVIPGRGAWVIEDLMAESIKGDAVDLMLPRRERAFREFAQVTFVRSGQ
jgi:3D (Asp-Asp-Asp) domain-containing protein